MTRLAVSWTSEIGRAYWSAHGSPQPADRHRAGLDAPAVDLGVRAARGPEVGSVGGRSRRVVPGDDPDGGARGRREVVEVDAPVGEPTIVRGVVVELQSHARSLQVRAGGHLALEVRRGSAAS